MSKTSSHNATNLEPDPQENVSRSPCSTPKSFLPPCAQHEEMPLQAALMYHFFLISSVLERAANRQTEQSGLTLPQWLALGSIVRGGEEGITHSELGCRLMLSKAPITGIVDRLERGEYVQRIPDAKDRRVSRIVICEKRRRSLAESAPGLTRAGG